MNPCEKCHRYPNCPKLCYPKIDWQRHLRRNLQMAKKKAEMKTDDEQRPA